MKDVCRAMGVRTDVPFEELTEEEKHIVYDGPMVKNIFSIVLRIKRAWKQEN